mmetsp:Transcript_4518/g.19210  ORF Transcript_4518/g.19210 Transcript_4518/m.19210 type:complete len:383 (+) Transcript_4518:2112-3260(+)
MRHHCRGDVCPARSADSRGPGRLDRWRAPRAADAAGRSRVGDDARRGGSHQAGRRPLRGPGGIGGARCAHRSPPGAARGAGDHRQLRSACACPAARRGGQVGPLGRISRRRGRIAPEARGSGGGGGGSRLGGRRPRAGGRRRVHRRGAGQPRRGGLLRVGAGAGVRPPVPAGGGPLARPQPLGVPREHQPAAAAQQLRHPRFRAGAAWGHGGGRRGHSAQPGGPLLPGACGGGPAGRAAAWGGADCGGPLCGGGRCQLRRRRPRGLCQAGRPGPGHDWRWQGRHWAAPGPGRAADADSVRPGGPGPGGRATAAAAPGVGPGGLSRAVFGALGGDARGHPGRRRGGRDRPPAARGRCGGTARSGAHGGERGAGSALRGQGAPL